MTVAGIPGPGPGAGRHYDALPRRQRRRLLLRSLLRAVLSASVLVALYYWGPLQAGERIKVGPGLILGLLVFAVVVAVQIGQIARARYPRLRAIEALATAVPLFLLLFAAGYEQLSQRAAESFTEQLDRTGALYYTITVFSTVGFGDIAPRTTPARVVTMVQMLADLLVFGVVARLLVDAVGAGIRRQATPRPDTEPGPGSAD